MKFETRTWAFVGIAAFIAPLAIIGTSHASDHADTPEIAANPGADLTDVYVFPDPGRSSKVVLAMNVHPLIAPKQGQKTYFDPNVLYQFKIDNNGDYVEDLVIQAKFGPAGPNQQVMIAGPLAPSTTGTRNVFETAFATTGVINQQFAPTDKMQVFAGGREDSFFFDLEQFFNILPDRASPITGMPAANPNQPQQLSWRPAGQAVDFLSNGGFNVLSIIVDLPKMKLMPANGSGKINVWCTTNVPHGDVYAQKDRLARPVVNEVLATVAYDRHKINDEAAPSEDAEELRYDILNFMTFPAHRSAAIRETVAAVLVPDVIRCDLNEAGPAAYLGVETGGATGSKFGGRALTDDVVDLSLGVLFGNTIPALGLTADDHREIPSLTSDNVDASGKHFLPSFPFLGRPR